MQIFTPIGVGYLSGAKIHIFLIGDSHGGGYRSMLYIFGKLLSSQCYDPFDMFSRYSRSKFGSLWSIGGTPKGRPGSTIIPNFTPIVLTVAEISVTGHKELLPI